MTEFADKYTFRELLNRLVQKGATLRLAEVLNINKSAGTIDARCIATGFEMPGARLSSVLNSSKSKVLFYPKKGSTVLVGIVDMSPQFLVLQMDEIDEIHLGGDSYSIVKGEELQQEIKKLQGVVDAMVQAFKSWVPPVGTPDSGAALKTTMIAALQGKATGSFSGILNETVKHGTR